VDTVSRVAVLAHGAGPADPSAGAWLGEWPVEPQVWLAIVVVGGLYAAWIRTVPAFPRWRAACFAAGLSIVALALASPIAAYDTSLFWVHVNQHLLLTVVAAPLLDLGAPVALGLRAATPTVRRRISRITHSAPFLLVTHPLVTWSLFVGVLWGSHFTPLYDLSLDNELVHSLEHALYLGSGLLFWWPVVAADPGSNRLTPPARLVYLFVTMPVHAFLGLAILSANSLLYRHYATTARSWGPSPLADQQIAGVAMWVEGGVIVVVAIVCGLYALLRHLERSTPRVDRRLERMLRSPSSDERRHREGHTLVRSGDE
jgi:cytochrome c oxidase assembly factor CtaG